jgi:hypothetical protein
MYIQSRNSSIDRPNKHGMVNPNVVSGSDYRNNMNYHGYVSSDVLVRLNEQKTEIQGRIDGLMSESAMYSQKSGNAMAEIQSLQAGIDVLKAKIAGTYGKFTFATPEDRQKAEFELSTAIARQNELGKIWEDSNVMAGNSQGKAREIGVTELAKVENEIAVITKNTTAETVADDSAVVVGSGGGGWSSGGGSSSGGSEEGMTEIVETAAAVPVLANDFLSKISAKIGITKNQLIFAGAGLVAVYVIIKTQKNNN